MRTDKTGSLYDFIILVCRETVVKKRLAWADSVAIKNFT